MMGMDRKKAQWHYMLDKIMFIKHYTNISGSPGIQAKFWSTRDTWQHCKVQIAFRPIPAYLLK